MPPRAFVAVHVGAGNHSPKREEEIAKLCTHACEVAMKTLRGGQSTIIAATEAVKLLEDHDATNAGFGSNLNRDGFVECDASIMEGISGLQAYVGAVPNVKNPILLARRLLENQRLSSQIAAPIVLVGTGAWNAARQWDLDTFDDWTPMRGSLVSSEARHRHRLHSSILEKQRPVDAESQDTVGCLILDFEGNISAAASSGGISLKMPGRVGPAGVPGVGIWVESTRDPENFTAGCCTSGAGEELIKVDYARSLCRSLRQSRTTPGVDTVTSQLLDCAGPRFVALGFLALLYDESYRSAEFWYGFTSSSMALGFMSSRDRHATAFVDRRGLHPSRVHGFSIL